MKNVKRFVAAFQLLKGRYKRHAIAALAFLAVLLFFGNSIKPVLVVAAFIIVASFSTFYHNYFRSPINFEMVKLFTITGSFVYGAAAGIIIGVSSVIIGRALSGRLDQDTVTSVAAISIVAFLASLFRSADIVFLGIILVIFYHILISPFIFLFGENKFYESVYIGTNILFNSIMFVKLAPFLVRIIS